MNKIETQILKNQVSIIRFLRFGFPLLETDNVLSNCLNNRLQETSDLFNPKQSQSLPEKTEGALGEQQGKLCTECKQIIGTNTMCPNCVRFRNSNKAKFGRREK